METRTRTNRTRGAFGIHSRIVAVSSKLAMDLMEKCQRQISAVLCALRNEWKLICSMLVHLMEFHDFIFSSFSKIQMRNLLNRARLRAP